MSWSISTPRARVFVPEAGINDFGGAIDPGQMRWIEATLKKNQKKTVVVLTHHNLVL
ncbi:MAG: hypothetical protein NT047_09320 [Deltaproteobacteria bacterium]|nr:hypothetical protein [Deltaproteobacteria bacterium]